MSSIKALTLWQPWASAVAIGAKRIETRSWPTRHRGPVAIHAARSRQGIRDSSVISPAWYAAIAPALPMIECGRLEADLEMLPRGVVLAIAELVDVIPVEDVSELDRRHSHPRELVTCSQAQPLGTWSERDLGDYRPGRYAFVLDNVRRVVPPSAADGRQRLWSWRLPPSIEGELGVITEGEP